MISQSASESSQFIASQGMMSSQALEISEAFERTLSFRLSSGFVTSSHFESTALSTCPDGHIQDENGVCDKTAKERIVLIAARQLMSVKDVKRVTSLTGVMHSVF